MIVFIVIPIFSNGVDINRVIWTYASGKLMTQFAPSLSIVNYSEADHHEKIQRMESGALFINGDHKLTYKNRK